MLTFFGKVGRAEAEIDQIDSFRILVADHDVFKLDIIMGEAHLMERFQALNKL